MKPIPWRISGPGVLHRRLVYPPAKANDDLALHVQRQVRSKPVGVRSFAAASVVFELLLIAFEHYTGLPSNASSPAQVNADFR